MITALCCPLQYGFYYFQLVFSFMIYRFVSHLQTVCFCCVFVTFSAEGSLQERAGESRDGDQENHSHHSRVQTGSDPASSVNTFLQTRHVLGFFFYLILLCVSDLLSAQHQAGETAGGDQRRAGHSQGEVTTCRPVR